MGRQVRLTAADGPFDAWREPAGEARRGGLVVLHAVWGITPHLRSLAAEWAAEGWEVLIPALLDPPGAPLPDRDTDPALTAERLARAEAAGQGEAVLPRVRAAIAAIGPPVMVMGFGFGGTAAWLAACRLEGVAATAAFYGGHVARLVGETPRGPTVLHFGRTDEMIPPEDVEAIRGAHPDLPVFVYDAGHAFVAPSGFHADSARLALLRTRQVFHRAAAGRGEHGA